jgi:hypothetical protein
MVYVGAELEFDAERTRGWNPGWGEKSVWRSSTLVDLCQKHQLDNAAAQCPLCSEVVASSEIFYQHLANHMEEFALLSLMPNLPCKFSTNVDVVATTSGAAVPDVVQQTSTLDHANICVGELCVVLFSEVVFERDPCRCGLRTSEQALEYLSVRTPDVCDPGFQASIANVSRVTIWMEACIWLEVFEIVLSELCQCQSVHRGHTCPTLGRICWRKICFGRI